MGTLLMLALTSRDSPEPLVRDISLIGYLLFAINMLIAGVYYRQIPVAIESLVTGDLFRNEDRPHLREVVMGAYRKYRMKRRVRTQTIVLFVIVLMGIHQCFYVYTPGVSWLEVKTGGVLSIAGMINFFVVSVFLVSAFQFIACFAWVSGVLFKIAGLVNLSIVHVSPWRNREHETVRHFLGLFWLGFLTLLPLVAYSLVRVLLLKPQGSIVAFEVGVYVPVLYMIVLPLILVGHVFPISRMFWIEKQRTLDRLSRVDLELLPTNAAELFAKAVPGDYSGALSQVELLDKIIMRTQRIRIIPINIKQIFVLVSPALLNWLASVLTL